MRTATGPHKGRLTVVSSPMLDRGWDYLANRPPLAIAPFKAARLSGRVPRSISSRFSSAGQSGRSRTPGAWPTGKTVRAARRVS